MADKPKDTMADKPAGTTEDIKESDIVFDCPFCGKSLAIDYRGAGLTIPCSDCGRDVEVPIPEGMEVTDIDSTTEEQEMRILNLRRSLAGAEATITKLEAELQELRDEHNSVAEVKQEDGSRFDEILARVGLAQRAMENGLSALADVQTLAGGKSPEPQEPEASGDS